MASLGTGVGYPAQNTLSDLLFAADRERDYAGYLSRSLPPLAANATEADQTLYALLQGVLGQQLAQEYVDEQGYYTGPEAYRQYFGMENSSPDVVRRLQYGDLSPVNLAAQGQGYADPALADFAQGQIYNAGLQDEWSFFGDQFTTALLGLGIATGGAAAFGGFSAAAPASATGVGTAAADIAPVSLGVGATTPPTAAFPLTAPTVGTTGAVGSVGALADIAPIALTGGGIAAPTSTLVAGGGGGGVLGTGIPLSSLVGPAISFGTDVVESIITGGAARDAANTQANAGRDANRLLWDLYRQQREDQAPFRAVGVAALPQLASMASATPVPPTYAPPAPLDPAGYGFTAPNAATLAQDPGYQFRLREGLKALDRSASARGTLLSGGQRKAINTYAQESASQEFQNAYQRALGENQLRYGRALAQNEQGTQRYADAFNTNFNVGQTLDNQRFNRLASLAGIGQTSTTALNNASGQYGGQAAQILQGIGNVRAAGQVGSANAFAGGVGALGSAAQQFQQQQALQDLLNQQALLNQQLLSGRR